MFKLLSDGEHIYSEEMGTLYKYDGKELIEIDKYQKFNNEFEVSGISLTIMNDLIYVYGNYYNCYAYYVFSRHTGDIH